MFQHATPLHAVWADDPDWTPPADGSPVSSWRNESGGGDPAATGTARPIYHAVAVSGSTPAMNGRPALWFDGVDDYLQVNIADVAMPAQFVAAVWPDAPVSNRTVFGLGVANSDISTNQWGRWSMRHSNALSSTTPMEAKPTILHVRLSNIGATGAAWLRVNGTEVVRGNAGGGSNIAWFKLGTGGAADAFSDRWWRGYIAFAGLYADATDCTTLIAALMAYYGATA